MFSTLSSFLYISIFQYFDPSFEFLNFWIFEFFELLFFWTFEQYPFWQKYIFFFFFRSWSSWYHQNRHFKWELSLYGDRGRWACEVSCVLEKWLLFSTIQKYLYTCQYLTYNTFLYFFFFFLHFILLYMYLSSFFFSFYNNLYISFPTSIDGSSSFLCETVVEWSKFCLAEDIAWTWVYNVYNTHVARLI